MSGKKTGTFLGLPYDWHRPTWARINASVWNKQDRRILPPKVYGWGLGINRYALLRRVGVVRR
ncbi:MAG: hypothetical protein AB7X49_20795 [Geminicoccaceae bacterium]